MQTSHTARPNGIDRRQSGLIRYPLVTYFVLAFAITWLLFAPISLGQNGLGLLPYQLPDGAVLLFFIVAAYGPLLAALIVTRLMGNPRPVSTGTPVAYTCHLVLDSNLRTRRNLADCLFVTS